jgi:glycosyltransferase involved in cell wall biosynthesis
MPYNAVALESLTKLNLNLEVDVFSWGKKKKLTPYNPPVIERVNFYNEENYDFDKLLTLYKHKNYKLIYICNRREKKYLKLAKFARKNSTIIIGQSDEQLFNTFRQYLKKVFSYFLYRQYFDLMCVPGYYQYEFMRFLGFKKDQVLIGAYTANIEIFNKFYLSNRTFYHRKCKNLLYLGRLEKEKGLNLLIQSLNSLKSDFEFNLKIIGSGSQRDLIENVDFVEYHPFMGQEDLINQLEDIDFFVLPSNYEPWGVVIHEMAAAGIPIICSDSCGARSAFVFNNYNGFVFKNNSEKSLNSCLQSAFNISTDRMIEFKKRSYELSKFITPQLWAETINSYLVE